MAEKKNKKSAKVRGLVLEYKSLIDGAPCLMFVTETRANPKTGPGLQTSYMRKSVNPLEASARKLDKSVCGMCPRRHSLKGDCYVALIFSPMAIYKAYKRGVYTVVKAGEPLSVEARRFLMRQTFVRFGAYGDPLSAPLGLAEWLLGVSGIKNHTGYSHLWQGAPEGASRLFQASCDDLTQEAVAASLGWGTFTATADPKGSPFLSVKSLLCPSEASDKLVTCNTCLKCDGRGYHIRATEHGMRSQSKNKSFTA